MRQATGLMVIIVLIAAPCTLAQETGTSSVQQEGIGTKVQAVGPEKLVGTWKLNKSLSEIPKPPSGGPGGGRPPGGSGGGMGGPGGGMGGPGGGMGGPGGDMGGPPGGGMGGPGEGGPGSESSGDRHGPPGARDGVTGAASLMVQLDGLQVKLVAGDGHVRTLTIDGQAVEKTRGRMTVTETAAFADGGIEVTSVADRGPTVTETLRLAEDGSGRLVHTVNMPRPDSDEPVKAVYVYDRETSAK